MKPRSSIEPETVVFGAKKCEEPRQTATSFREDKLKKIHKTSQHRKPAKMLVTTRQQISQKLEQPDIEEPDPFRELFEKVYRERSNLSNLMQGVRKVEEVVTPQELAAYLVESMTWAVSCYRSELSISCIRIFNNTLKQEGSSVVDSLSDLAQNRRNLLGLLHTIYEEFASVVIGNQMAVNVVHAVAQKNPAVKQWLMQPDTFVRAQVLNCSFFQQLMDRNDMLRSFCVFADQLLTEQLMELSPEQRKQLQVVAQLSKVALEQHRPSPTPASKRNRKKKKPSLTPQQLQEQQTAQLISEFDKMSLPPSRLMVEFTDDFLLGISKRMEDSQPS